MKRKYKLTRVRRVVQIYLTPDEQDKIKQAARKKPLSQYIRNVLLGNVHNCPMVSISENVKKVQENGFVFSLIDIGDMTTGSVWAVVSHHQSIERNQIQRHYDLTGEFDSVGATYICTIGDKGV